MYKSFVLKHVAEPARLLFASMQATVMSLCLWIATFMLALLVLKLSLMKAFIGSVIIFLAIQCGMIFKSQQDPYFINVLMTKFKCRKTKNIISTQDNLYGS